MTDRTTIDEETTERVRSALTDPECRAAILLLRDRGFGMWEFRRALDTLSPAPGDGE